MQASTEGATRNCKAPIMLRSRHSCSSCFSVRLLMYLQGGKRLVWEGETVQLTHPAYDSRTTGGMSSMLPEDGGCSSPPPLGRRQAQNHRTCDILTRCPAGRATSPFCSVIACAGPPGSLGSPSCIPTFQSAQGVAATAEGSPLLGAAGGVPAKQQRCVPRGARA